ncbi:Plasma membrane-associated cation-binding protein 1 [Dichanthelium oligosanthes]|uniref:Plasma membrane-associated cation-binding protein 1 n=1 Tax=Dichanthelium oligosanthes TaxID=888268 RepID=A0A1E5VKD9_9POAL|nr:Plasma membrane-associated cation-binding protein 1 [Dichanthelium oligosanthes]
MDTWKSKVLPKIKLIFAKTGGKKAAAAAELVKSFDESKEGINGEFEEKKADLQPKIVEIYESAPAPLKVLIKERSKVSVIKKNSAAITKFFEDLAKIEFPGAKQVSEGISKVGPALLSGPIFSTFEKVSTLLPVAAEEQPKEAEATAAATEEAAAEKKDDAAVEEKKEEAAGEKKEEAPVAEEEKKEEAPAATEETAAAESAPPAAATEPAAEAAPAEAAAEAAAAPAEPEAEPAKAEEETPKA